MKTSLIQWTAPAVDRQVGKAAQPGAGCLHKKRLKAWLRSLVERMAPLGYQDEKGFHYGEQKPEALEE